LLRTRSRLLLFRLPFLIIGFAASLRLSAQDPPPADYSKEPYVIEQALYKLKVENDGTSTFDAAVRVHVQSQAGLQDFGVLQFGYASATSTLDVQSVRVTKPDHRIVQTPPENILDQPAQITREAPFYSDLKEKQVAVKGLEVGDTLEYAYRERVTMPLAPGEYWFQHSFIRVGVVLQEELEVSVPLDRYLSANSSTVHPTVTEKGAYRVLDWKTSHLEPTSNNKKSQVEQPDEQKPADVLLSSFRTWDEIGNWVKSLVDPQVVPTPEIKAKAAELTRDAKTDSEKIHILYDYVSLKFRYIGIDLGIGRYQPHSAADVLSNGYGDCKDKHTLFSALLAAVGIKAYPALISSGADIDRNVPSPEQFNHMITALPQEKGILYLDTTPEVAPFGLLLEHLRDKTAVVVPDSGSVQLLKTPADPPMKSTFVFAVDGSLDSAGTFKGRMSLTLRGDLEVAYRFIFRRAGQTQWQDTVQKISQLLGFGGTVSDVDVSSPEETEKPFTVGYNYERKEYSDWADKQITPPFPPVFLPAAPEKDSAKSKPIPIGSPQEFVLTAAMKLPEGAHPTPPPNLVLTESFAIYHAIYTWDGEKLHVNKALSTKASEVSVDQIEAYRKFVDAVIQDSSTFIPLFGKSALSGGSNGSIEAQSLVAQGSAAWAQGNMSAAADAYERAIKTDPNYAFAWISLGSLHLANGKIDQGIAETKKGIALDPTQASFHERFAQDLTRVRRNEEALDAWRGFEKMDPGNDEALSNIAYLLFTLKQYADAVPALQAAVKKHPDNPGLSFELGQAYLETGDKEKGIAELHRCVDTDASGVMLNEVGYVLAEQNLDLQDALEYAKKAVARVERDTAYIKLSALSTQDVGKMPSLAAYWDTLGWVHFRLGHYEQAEKYLNAAWSLGQESLVGEHLGETYEKEGKKHDAIVAYTRAMSARDAPAEINTRLNELRAERKSQTGEEFDKFALQKLRTIKLGRLAKKHASAEFFVLIASGPKIVDVKFVSGSEDLQDAGKALQSAKFDVPFPDGSEAQIVRRGILDCEPELAGCEFVVIPPNSVHALK
jgi:tetratricopeptide (TPR) repeat protein